MFHSYQDPHAPWTLSIQLILYFCLHLYPRLRPGLFPYQILFFPWFYTPWNIFLIRLNLIPLPRNGIIWLVGKIWLYVIDFWRLIWVFIGVILGNANVPVSNPYDWYNELLWIFLLCLKVVAHFIYSGVWKSIHIAGCQGFYVALHSLK